MASAAAENRDQEYACKCLNIHIRPVSTETMATELIADADFTPIFVGEQGITVVSTTELFG